MTGAAGQKRVPEDYIKDYRPYLPPLATQQAIADFLDRETGEIDRLIEAKERLLRLLAEKRRALIAHAVTRGLDNTAPTKDSNIPWLGEIPEHWEVWKVAHFAVVGNGSTPSRENTDYWSDGSIPWLNSSVVNLEEVFESEQFVTEVAVKECHLPLVPANSLLVGITGQGKTRGQVTINRFVTTINQHIAYLSPKENFSDVTFLRAFFVASYAYLRNISDGAGGTKGALTCEELSSLHIPLPPLDEQLAIVTHIEEETAKLDRLRDATVHSITLLKERRTALIAETVTGKLGVGRNA